MNEDLKEIIARVKIILSENELLEDKTIDKEKLNDVLSKSKEKVKEFIDDFIYKGLRDKTPKNKMTTIINNFCNSLNELEATDCADYLRPLLLEKLDKDLNKSLLRLKLEHYQALIYSLLFILAIVGYKFYNHYDVSYPILSVNGINNAISICKKIDRHDSIVGSHVHTKGSGWGKRILSWPFKPSDEELEYYQNYIGTLHYVIVSLSEDSTICDVGHWQNLKDTDKLMKDIEKINENLEKEIKNLSKDALEEQVAPLIVQVIQKTFPCK